MREKLEKIIDARMGQSSIGFGAELIEKNEKNVGELLKQVLPQDLVKFGLIPEFVGRVPITVSLELLDENALVRILTEPKNALIKQYRKLFHYDEVELKVTDEAVAAIAKKSFERKTGARGLRAIMENIMMDVMYEIPSDDSIACCTITKDTVEKGTPPELEYRTDVIATGAVSRAAKKNKNGETA